MKRPNFYLTEGFRRMWRRGMRLLVQGGASATGGAEIGPDESDADFVMTLYETLLERGASIGEFARWRDLLATGVARREDVLKTFYNSRAREAAGRAELGRHPYPVMGTDFAVKGSEWRERATESRQLGRPVRFSSRFPPPKLTTEPVASVITSLYKGGVYIEQFLEMITSQTIFSQCELIIIDANSPEGESNSIKKYCERFPQINYVRLPYTVTIYAAWNLGARLASGRYLTNANVDDLRRRDSLELQASTLDALDFVDIVYQDFVYAFEQGLEFDEVARLDLRSDVPVANRLSLSAYNQPHNAPMWRRSLHEDVGYFDDCLRSGADWDFWMRCLLAGKQFFKLNDPHVSYYVNPTGISTAANGVGAREVREVHRRHWRQLLPPAVVADHRTFIERCGLPADTADRPASHRYAMVQELLRRTALDAERPCGPVDTPTGRLRVLVDGVAFQKAASDTYAAQTWAAILEELARGAQVTVLDRGNLPAIKGVTGLPFPSYRNEEAAADSRLIERFCHFSEANVFLSTGRTSPLATPSVAMVSEAESLRSESRDAHELELSILFARHRIVRDLGLLERVNAWCPSLETTSLTVFDWEHSPSAGAVHVIEMLYRAMQRWEAKGDKALLSGWGYLRGIQADVDFG